MTKEERKLVERLAVYATRHQDEHVDLIYIACSLWQLSENNLNGVKNTLSRRGY